MAKKIEHSDIIQKDVFAPTIENAKALIDILNKVEKELKDILNTSTKIAEQTPLKSYENIKTVENSVKRSKEAVEGLSKVEKERIKLQEKLKELNTDRIQDNEELKVQISEQRKINKELAKDSLGLVGAYEKEAKRLAKLRKEYKNLIISEGKTTKESRKLLKEIKNLDKELKDVDASTGQFQRNVGNYPKVLNGATKKLLVLAGALASVKGAADLAQSSLESTEEGSEDLRKVSSGLQGALKQTKNVLASAALDLFDFGKGLINGEKRIKDIGKAFDRTSKATENFGEKIQASIDAEIQAEQAAINFEKALRPLEIQIAKITGEIDKQLAIAGDTTRSFDEIEKAAERAQEAQISRANIIFKIANEELKIIRLRLTERQKAGLNVLDLLDQEKDAEIKLQEARNELLREQLDNQKILRENARDRFERELDFAIDAFDSQKTVNERQIADEQKTLNERRNLIEETISLTEKSFQEQIKLIQEFTGQRINLNELAQESDEAVIRERLRAFTFDDVTLGRILEIIRERKIAIQDLAEANRDLAESEQEGLDIRSEIAAQEIALEKGTTEAIEQLDLDLLDAQILNLKRRLTLQKEGSIEFLRVQKELNDALLQQLQERLEKEENAEKEAAENRKELRETGVAVLEEIAKKSTNKRIDAINEEINAAKEREKKLTEIARKGVESATENLAFEQKKQVELERKREAELKRQQRTELALTALKTYSSKVDAGDEKPLVSTIRDVTLLTEFVKNLPLFYEGTEDTGKGGSIDNKGGFLAVLHPNERIINAEENKKIGAISNTDLSNLAFAYNSGEGKNLTLKKFDEITNAINNKPVYMGKDYDAVKKSIIDVVVTKNKIERNHRKVSGIW